MQTKLLSCLAKSQNSALSLICFAHAGGGRGRFREWPQRLIGCADIYAALLPGRESKLLEAPMDDLAAIAVQVVRELPATPERGIVLVGISFGALLAFEVACLLANRGSPPLGLFVASQRAPSLAGEAHSWHTLDDERLIEKLVEIGGMEARDASDPEFQDLFLGAIRADLRASETYRPPPRRPLNFPIFVYRGSHDSVVSDEDCRAWQAETSSMVTLRTLEAGHFLTGEAGDLWLAALHADLEKVGVTSFFLT